MSPRARLGIAIATGVVAGVIIISTGWWGYRVYTELRPGSWRAPTEVFDRNGKTLVALYGAEWKVAEPVIIGTLPPYVPNAFLAAEDERFRHHIGIDPIGITRALFADVRARGVAEGGSTITQQLARMTFLSNQRTLGRKLAEIPLALMIEMRLSKDEILEAYLNDVYIGNRDGREVRGLGEAAHIYFGKSPEQLTPAEVALIAGMIRAPNRDNPDENLAAAKQRRDAVLDVMLNKKWITKDQHDAAVSSGAQFHPGGRLLRPYPFMLAALRQEFIDRIGERALLAGGVKIYTPVDRDMQNAAQLAIAGGTTNLRRSHGWLQRRQPLQGALLSVEPQTGGIRALVGGSNFQRSQYDRTRLMQRQLGSAAKPFAYSAAIASRTLTTATVIDDEPVQIRLASNKVWEPKNYDEQFHGPVTVREAFEQSLNVPAVRVAQQVGVDRVRDVWKEAGFSGDLSDTPAIALGVDDVSMREVVAAYSIFPNLGERTEPHLIDKVVNQKGDEIYHYEVQQTPAIDPAVAYVIHSLMRGVVLRGTAARLNSLGLGTLAGKTGTTSNYRDAWFIGYSPDLLTAVWVGFDDGTPLRMSSGEAAVPIWGMYMQRVPHSSEEIRPPTGVSFVEIEETSGRRWQPGCGPSIVEVFLAGTEPNEQCGGPFNGSMDMGQYQEPPIISDEQPMDTMGMELRPRERVHDPDAAAMPPEMDTAQSSGDTAPMNPPVDVIRGGNRQRPPSRVIVPPVDRTQPPPQRLPTPAPPPPARDTSPARDTVPAR